MKIGIDASQVIYETGVSVYTRNLVSNLLEFDKENDYLIFGGSLRRTNEIKTFISEIKSNRLSSYVYPLPPVLMNIIWNRLHILPIEKLIGKIDVFHSSDWTQPPTKAYKITTIHDLTFLKYPKLTPPKTLLAQRSRLRWVIKEVDKIIVPSKTIEREILNLGVEKERVRVIPEASDNIFRKQSESKIAKLKSKYRISGDYILAVGVNPRKNVERIIQAYEKIKADTKLRLVIVGHPYYRVETGRGIIFTGHVDKDEMPTFYSGSKVLVFPSLYEGFGLPILEAFACKTPVVTSNIGSMAEVAGNAAVLVNPFDIGSISQGILKALSEKVNLIKRGSIHSKNFSWELTARETVKIYNEFNKKL